MTRLSGEHSLHVKTEGLLRRLVRRDAAGALRKVLSLIHISEPTRPY